MSIGEKLKEKIKKYQTLYLKNLKERERDLIGTLSIDDRKSSRKKIE
jgi:hypothetical protein